MAASEILATLTDAEASAVVALMRGLVAGGVTAETAGAVAANLGMAQMQTVLDGLAQVLDEGDGEAAAAAAAVANARSVVAEKNRAVGVLRATGGHPADAEAAVVMAAQAVGAAAQALGAWAQAIAAAIPQG